MRKGIKEKDIRDFIKACERLDAVINRICEYCPEANLFAGQDSMCLMAGDWHDDYNYEDYIVESYMIHRMDSGAF